MDTPADMLRQVLSINRLLNEGRGALRLFGRFASINRARVPPRYCFVNGFAPDFTAANIAGDTGICNEKHCTAGAERARLEFGGRVMIGGGSPASMTGPGSGMLNGLRTVILPGGRFVSVGRGTVSSSSPGKHAASSRASHSSFVTTVCSGFSLASDFLWVMKRLCAQDASIGCER
jgi:hypothetical protein